MFSKKIEYGYILLKELKNTDEKNLKLAKEILKDLEIPYTMGLTILTDLVNSGLLISIKGKHGGFYLKEKKISFFDLFIALERKDTLIFLQDNFEIKNTEYNLYIYELGKIMLQNMRRMSII